MLFEGFVTFRYHRSCQVEAICTAFVDPPDQLFGDLRAVADDQRIPALACPNSHILACLLR